MGRDSFADLFVEIYLEGCFVKVEIFPVFFW